MIVDQLHYILWLPEINSKEFRSKCMIVPYRLKRIREIGRGVEFSDGRTVGEKE